jgi:hypothetical protein
MSKKKSTEVAVKFRSPSFKIKGKKYISKDVEAAAKEGDESAIQIIATLVQKQSSIVSVEEVESPVKEKKSDQDPESQGGADA